MAVPQSRDRPELGPTRVLVLRNAIERSAESEATGLSRPPSSSAVMASRAKADSGRI